MCSAFKLENIYCGVRQNVCGKNVFDFIKFAGTYFCGPLEKSQKLEPVKISFHAVGMCRPTEYCFGAVLV